MSTTDETDGLLALAETKWATFVPRPNKPEEFDQQSAFVNARDLVSFALGGNACLAADTMIYDPVAKVERRLDSIDGPFHVWSRNPTTGRKEVGLSCRPFQKGRAKLFRVTLSDSSAFVGTLGHRILDARGTWRRVEQLRPGDALMVSDARHHPSFVERDRAASNEILQLSLSDSVDGRSTCRIGRHYASEAKRRHPTPSFARPLPDKAPRSWLSQDVFHSSQIQEGSPERCWLDCRQCGVLPPRGEATGLEPVPLLVDALECSHSCLPSDARLLLQEHSRPCRLCAHPSSCRCDSPERPMDALHNRIVPALAERSLMSEYSYGRGQVVSNVPASHSSVAGRQFHHTSFLHARTKQSSPRSATPRVALEGSHSGETLGQCRYVTSITEAGEGDYWDIQVWPHHNYEVAGVFHHNSGKTAGAAKKCADFVLSQPPPRKDSPFWIVGATYKQVCAVCWAEKLHGEQFIPDCEVEFGRISWRNSAMGWPATVPLKPWPDGSNWCLEFMSYEQGRAAMQARSICGFWFSEQFPWSIFIEVLRGCRDYMYPGGQFCEFTPIDPELCMAIEKIMDSPPQGWAFYRLNTEANRVNLATDWYDQFFDAVPDEMMATRKTGALASFEGVIYQSFSIARHVTEDDSAARRSGMHHFRATDWGASAEHPFVTVWGCHDAIGDWLVYDEYWNNSQDAITLDHAVEVLARSLFWGWPRPPWFKDPDRARRHFVERVEHRLEELSPPKKATIKGSHYRENFADPSRPGEIQAFGYYGIPTASASNDVFKGIDLVRSRLKPHPASGRPGLRFHRRCQHCIDEHRKYRWIPKRKNDMGGFAASRAVPLKKWDDACDATRYMIASAERGRGQAPSSTDSYSDHRRRDVLLARAGSGVRAMDAASSGFFKR